MDGLEINMEGLLKIYMSENGEFEIFAVETLQRNILRDRAQYFADFLI